MKIVERKTRYLRRAAERSPVLDSAFPRTMRLLEEIDANQSENDTEPFRVAELDDVHPITPMPTGYPWALTSFALLNSG